MRVVAIITARGGSKRIPRKNIRDFMGRPMIDYAIRAALGSRIFEEVMVSTDSEEIAAASKQSGAEVPFMRSGSASSDLATTAGFALPDLRPYMLFFCGAGFWLWRRSFHRILAFFANKLYNKYRSSCKRIWLRLSRKLCRKKNSKNLS